MREDGAPEAAGASQVWGAAGAQTAATACGAPRGLGSTRWGPPPRAPGFPSAASRRRPAPNTGGLRKWRRAEGLRFRLGREAAGERSLKTLPPGKLKGRTGRRSAVPGSEGGKKRARGKKGPGTHGSWRRQRLRPASVASPRSGRRCRPRPLRATTPSRPLRPAPARPDADSHWAEESTWSAVPRASPGGRRAKLGGRSRRARGGASRERWVPRTGETRPGHVGGGVGGGVRLAMWRPGGAEHVTGHRDLMWDSLGY